MCEVIVEKIQPRRIVLEETEKGNKYDHNEGWDEIDGFHYTGRKVSAMINYIDDYGCQHGYVNLSYSKVGLMIAGEGDE